MFFFKIITKIILGTILNCINRLFFKKKIILLQCHNPYLYCENTKFLYEKISEDSSSNVYWVTKSEEVSKYLRLKNLNYINFNENIIKFFWVLFNTKIVIDTGTKFLNPFYIFSFNKKIKKITTYHGYGPKTMIPLKKNHIENKKQIKDHQKFDYINFTSEFIKSKFVKNFKLKLKNCITFGFPRCDQLFENKPNKKLFNYLLKKNKINSKIILYTPTWRPYYYDFPLNKLNGLNYQDFNCFLIKHNIYFFYSFHANQKFNKISNKFSRIIYIDHLSFPFYDTTSFMKEVDILFNDYSTSTTDFCITEKPQIFFLPDFNKYEKEKGFLENYKKNLIGTEIKTYDELKKEILINIKNKKIYISKYKTKISLYKRKYYSNFLKKSCNNFSEFIKNL